MKVNSFADRGRGEEEDGARPAQDTENCRKKSLMKKDHYQIFMCIVAYVYNYSMILTLITVAFCPYSFPTFERMDCSIT
jgi:hypothetical protein